MTTISQPFITLNITGASTVVQNQEQKVLFVGSHIPGSAADGALTTNIGNSETQLNTLFGSRSSLAAMLRAARRENKVTRFDAISLENTGTAATSDITITGPATSDGTITIDVGSATDYSFVVTVTSGDDQDTIAAAINTAISANSLVPVTSSVTTNVVTLTAAVAGTNGDKIDLQYTQSDAAGVSVAISAFSGGNDTINPSTALDVIGDERYQTIIWEYVNDPTQLAPLITFLDSRFNVDNTVLDGVGFVNNTDVESNLTSAVNLLNSQSIVYIGSAFENINTLKGPAQLELDWVKSAVVGSIRALRLTPGASIANYVLSSSGPLDAFGGPALASKPYFNTKAPNLPIIAIGNGWSSTQIETLKNSGISVVGNNIARNTAVFGELVTTYKTDAAGNPDPSFKFLNYVDTISAIREFYFNNLKSRFAQTRLTAGDVIRGRDMANELTIRAYCERLYQELSGEDFVLVQAGETAQTFYKENLTITLDLATGTVTLFMIVPIVTQVREILGTIKLSFTTNA